MKHHIVLIEDEVALAEVLRDRFEVEGHQVSIFLSAEDYYQSDIADTSIYLIDWFLPGDNGDIILSKIRSDDQDIPIFMVTGNDSDDAAIEMLKKGADDYIRKPYNIDELYFKVCNFLEKRVPQDRRNHLELIKEGKLLVFKDKKVSLTSREFSIFEVLHNHPDQFVPRSQMIEQLSDSKSLSQRNIDVHIVHLRKKLDNLDLTIETKRGKGYQLKKRA